jgi:transformation/transcription domain-associated protein
MYDSMEDYTDIWFMRKQFTAQMAAVTFMTYILSVNQRSPPKFYISMKSGNIWTSDLLPCKIKTRFFSLRM